MAIYGYEPPDLEFQRIEDQRKKENQYKAIKANVDAQPEIGVNLEGIVNKFGNILGREIMVGSALLGFTEESPEISALVQRQIEIEQENSKKFTERARAVGRGVVRSAFVGMDSFAESLIKRPYQAAARASIDGGKSPQHANWIWLSHLLSAGNGEHVIGMLTGDEEYADRYKQARKNLGPTVATRAINDMAAGKTVNLGRGYFGNSTLARDTEIYKELSSTIKDPAHLEQIENVIQQQLGTAITQEERASVESNRYRGQVISPGRIMAMNFANPNTERYKKISGLIDGVVTLGLDPFNLVGGQFTRLTRSGRQFFTGNKMNGWLNAKKSGNTIYQAAEVNIKGKKATRYVDVGDQVLEANKVYEIDELVDVAKEGGLGHFKFYKDTNGATVKTKVKNTRGSAAARKENAVTRVNKGEHGTDILVDASQLSKTLAKVGPQEKVKALALGISEDFTYFGDEATSAFDDYIDFAIDHSTVKGEAFAGELDNPTIQKLADEVSKVGKAADDGDKAAIQKIAGLEAELDKNISTYVKGLREGRVRNIERAKSASGLSKFLKPSLNKTQFEDWHNTTGKNIYNFLYDQIQTGGMEYRDIMKLLPDISPASKGAIIAAKSADEIGDVIAREVRVGNITKRLDPYSYTFKGHLSRKAGKVLNRNGKSLDDGGRIDFSDMGDFLGIGAVVSRKATDNKMYRLFKEVAPSFITAHSSARGFKEIEKLIDSMPFNKQQRTKLYNDLIDTNVRLDEFAIQNNRISKLRLTEEFYKLLLGDDMASGLLGEVQKMLTAKGFPQQFSGGVLDFIAEVKNSRAYWISLVGDEIVDVGFTGAKSKKAGQSITEAAKTQLNVNELEGLAQKGDKDGIVEFITQTFDGDQEFALPTAQLMSEMLTGNIPLPDMNETFRILGTFRNTLYQMTKLDKLGPKRIDLPQLLSLDGNVDEITDLAKKDDGFAQFIANWSSNEKQSVKKLTDEYTRITGEKYSKVPNPKVLEIFDALDNAQMVQEAFGAGNIAANALTKNIAKIFYKYDKDAAKLTNSVLIRLSNTAVSSVWKPFQLLRFAWTVRVISEEQLRMYAADLSNMWTHPISHIAYAMNRKASVDILGDAWAESLLFKQAMSKGSNGTMIRRADSMDRFMDTVTKDIGLGGGEGGRRYDKGWATELTLLSDDDLAVEVAKVIRGKSEFKTLDELATHLVRTDVQDDRLVKAWQTWAEEGDAMTISGRRSIVKDQDRSLEFLESLQARLIDKTGGKFSKYIKVQGKKVPLPKNVVYKSSQETGLPLRMYYQIDENGRLGGSLLDGIADGEVSFLKGVDKDGNEIYNKLTLGQKGSERQFKELYEQLGKFRDDGPEVVKVSRELTRKPGVGESYNKLVAAWFDILMSKPSNWLSRSPAFKQFYWQRVTDSAYSLSADALDTVVANARAAKVDRKIIKQLENTIPTQGGVSNLTEWDEIIKAVTLEDVQGLLYDLNKRSQFSQATSLLFPFAEVHKEIAGTWTRLLRDNPTKLRKMYLTVDSLKESDPTSGAEDGDSFIYTDPLTNEEVFVIPVVDKVLNNYFQKGQFFGGEDITDDSTRMRTVGFASSANIVAGGIIPGVGPAVQIAAQYLVPNMKENTAIYKTVFPFGTPENASDYLVPSWIRKFIGLSSKAPESWTRQYTNTQKDLMRAKLIAGHITMNSEAQVQQALQETKRQAWVLTFIRGGVQGSFLTGGSFRWEKEVMPGGSLYMNPEELVKSGVDPNGRYFAFNVLASAYYRILRENGGDSLTATTQFTKMFGYDPTALLISKSKEVRRTPYTEPGLAAANDQFFQELPDVAYYFQPDSPLDEFSYVAWIQSFTTEALGEGQGIARYDLELNEWAALYNQASGRLAMEQMRRSLSTPGSADYVPVAKVRNEMLFRYNETLKEYFPGFDIQPRTPGPTDLDEQLRQLRVGAARADLKDNAVAKALNIYFESYDNYVEVLQRDKRQLQVNPKGGKGYYVREQFRQHAEELYTAYPEFYYVWNDILSKQLNETLSKLLEEGATL